MVVDLKANSASIEIVDGMVEVVDECIHLIPHSMVLQSNRISLFFRL